MYTTAAYIKNKDNISCPDPYWGKDNEIPDKKRFYQPK